MISYDIRLQWLSVGAMMAIRLVRRDAFLDRHDEGCLEVCRLRHSSDLALRVSGLRQGERLDESIWHVGTGEALQDAQVSEMAHTWEACEYKEEQRH